MQRLTYAAHLTVRDRAVVRSVQFRAHHILPVAGHQKTGHRPQRFRQRRRRTAVQQAKRLVGARIHRHLRFQRIVPEAGIDDAKVFHHRVLASGIQFVEG